MKKGILLCCFSLWLLLVNVTATSSDIPDLNNIIDLRERTNFSRQFPRYGQQLLFWFANNIDIDQNDRITLNSRIDPTRGDYGFHLYHNYEETLPIISGGMRYFSVGNLNTPTGLPNYVTQDYDNSWGLSRNLRNIDRIVIRMNRNNPQNVIEVLITQHFEDRNRGSGYDRSNTFRVSPTLLRQIQDIRRNRIIMQARLNQPLPTGIINNQYRLGVPLLQRVYPIIPGLTLFMTLARYNVNYRLSHSRWFSCVNSLYRDELSTDILQSCEPSNRIKLVVKSTSNGYARITWSEVPENIAQMKSSVCLYKDQQQLTVYSLDGRTYGAIDTRTALNSGLQVHLITADKTFWVGPQFNEASGALPTEIAGYDASLQLFTKDGYACARLFIKKTFSNWKTVFENSWVGFYRSYEDANKNYQTYQWSIYFAANYNLGISEDYNVFDYKSGKAICPGMQLRFLLDKQYYKDRAHTKPWEVEISRPTIISNAEL